MVNSATSVRVEFFINTDIASSSNMLYPKEDRLNNTLMFACRTCQFSEPAASSCVFRNNLYNTTGDTAGVTQDVGADPTVGSPDSCTCTLCGEELLCSICGEAACTGSLGAVVVPVEIEEDMSDTFSDTCVWEISSDDHQTAWEDETEQRNKFLTHSDLVREVQDGHHCN